MSKSNQDIKKKIERAKGELTLLESFPPDRTITKAKQMLKVRIKTLEELEDSLREAPQ